MTQERTPASGIEERLWGLLSEAVPEILRHEDPASFLAWLREAAPRYPELFPRDRGGAGRRAAVLALQRAIWNATPLPSEGYRPRLLPAPADAAPCPSVTPEVIWPLLVQHVPLADIERLGGEGALPPEALLGAARRLRAEADLDRAASFLEAALARAGPGMDDRHAPAVDLLVDACDETGRVERFRPTLERLADAAAPPFRARLLLHAARLAAEAGESALAWERFERAQVDDPLNPRLARFEVIFLLKEGRAEQAAQRARFWRSRLARRLAEDPDARAFLELAAADPAAALAAVVRTVEERTVYRLSLAVSQSSSRPLPTYLLAQEPGLPGAFALQPLRDMLRLEQGWSRVWPQSKPRGLELEAPGAAEIWRAEGPARLWLAFLGEHPEAFDSLSVLDDLALAVLRLQEAGSLAVDSALLLPLVERGEAILAGAIATRPGARVPWSVAGNRPALRLLLIKLQILERHGDPAAAAQEAERLLSLNPRDEHGVREWLKGAAGHPSGKGPPRGPRG